MKEIESFGYLAAKHKAIRDPILWPTIDASEMLSSTIADSSHVAKAIYVFTYFTF